LSRPTTDSLLALWEALAVLGILICWQAGDIARRRWGAVLGWLAVGLGFLTKGPPAVLPIAALTAFALRRRRPDWLRGLTWPPAVALGLIVGGWWYALAAMRLPNVMHYFVAHELAGRLLSGAYDRHGQWYGFAVAYGPVLLLGALPWLAVVPFALPCSRSPPIDARGEPLGLLGSWLLLPLAVLCLSRSRLPLYVLPCFAPLSLLLARTLGAALTRSRALVPLRLRACPGRS
jgi:4-amino-4-deoxy-L-arabinose transferase